MKEIALRENKNFGQLAELLLEWNVLLKRHETSEQDLTYRL
jgi:hypothetical protein